MSTIRDKANRFAIYRAAEAADWVTTPEEIAAVTHVEPATVRRIMAAAGWLRRLAQRDALPAADAIPGGARA